MSIQYLSLLPMVGSMLIKVRPRIDHASRMYLSPRQFTCCIFDALKKISSLTYIIV